MAELAQSSGMGEGACQFRGQADHTAAHTDLHQHHTEGPGHTTLAEATGPVQGARSSLNTRPGETLAASSGARRVGPRQLCPRPWASTLPRRALEP